MKKRKTKTPQWTNTHLLRIPGEEEAAVDAQISAADGEAGEQEEDVGVDRDSELELNFDSELGETIVEAPSPDSLSSIPAGQLDPQSQQDIVLVRSGPATVEQQQIMKQASKKYDDLKPADSSYWHGWDAEVHRAWRSAPGSSVKEYAEEIYRASFSEDTDAARARFNDDTFIEIADLSCAEIASLTRASIRSSDSFWEGTHATSHLGLRVWHRKDRDPQGIISLTEQTKQICSIYVKFFDDKQKAVDTFFIFFLFHFILSFKNIFKKW